MVKFRREFGFFEETVWRLSVQDWRSERSDHGYLNKESSIGIQKVDTKSIR